jgi:hypothetical protein
MSAWLCSDKHLSVLACYAVKHNLDLLGECDDPLRVREERAFRKLKRENVASLDARYPGDKGDAGPEETWRLDDSARHDAVFGLSMVTIIKLCHCYAYQACEHKGWATSLAKKLVDAIEAHAIRRLPGYDKAPWGI